MLKADAYGLSTELIAPIFQDCGANLFFTANLEEALAIRHLPEINQIPIAVFSGVSRDEEAEYQRHNIIPVLNSLWEIAHYRKYAQKQALPAFLHLDTGMNRLGLRITEIETLIADHSLLTGLKIQGILSHFVSSDLPESGYNAQQLQKIQALKPHFPYPFIVANSAGIFLGSDYHFDGVKPGAALYGIYRHQFKKIANVVTLSASILQISSLKPNETSGYDATYTAKSPIITATVACGYADGYLRYAENNRPLSPRFGIINDIKVLLIGRVSMDLILFDITDAIKIKPIYPGDPIILLSDDYDLNEFARECNTIGHEVLTAMGKRVKRELV